MINTLLLMQSDSDSTFGGENVPLMIAVIYNKES